MYDLLGRRTGKNTLTYLYDSNGNLVKISNGMSFLYDNGGVFALEYNNATYFYRKNAQNDIIAILDTNGDIVVKYVYDAWGNHKVFDASGVELEYEGNENNIAFLNPFRYRSYFYDAETGLYYLNARYYDPQTGRFISLDDISYLDPDTVNGLNLYAYCGNNPVMFSDESGHMPEWLKCVVAVVAVVAVATATVLTCGVAGAGAAAVGAAMLAGGTVSAGINAIDQLHDGGSFDWTELAISTLSGTAYGLVVGLTGGVAGSWSWAAFGGKMAVAGGTSLLNSWNQNKNATETFTSLGTALGLSAGTQVLGHYVPRIVNKFLLKISSKAGIGKSAFGDVISNLWDSPAIKTGVMRFGTGVATSIFNDLF